MTEDITTLRAVLARVAAGDLDPTEAARLLDEDPTQPTVDRAVDAGESAGRTAVAGIVIKAGGVKLRVIGDPSVDTAVAEGPHAVRRDGSTLVVECPSGEGYRTTDAPKFLGWVPAVWTGGRGEKVTVRVNPSLPLTLEGTACSIEVVGLATDLALSTISSAVKVRDHRGAVRGSASMCSVDVAGALTGPGSLLCELGSINLRLVPGSDLALTATGEMSSIRVAGARADHAFAGSPRQSLVVGAGSTPFDLTVRMGSATVVAA